MTPHAAQTDLITDEPNQNLKIAKNETMTSACLAQSVERQALNLMVVGSSPTVGVHFPDQF